MPWRCHCIKRCCLLLCLSVLFLIVRPGQVEATDRAEFSAWLDALRIEAQALGLSAETLDRELADLQPLPEVIAADRNQPEFKRTLPEYLELVINDRRVRQGQELLRRHRRLFEKLSAQYRIPPRILVSLWGIETDFGSQQGVIPVIPALATLAHDGRRSDYFRGELFAALQLVDSGRIPSAQMRGSWAGAMGQLQFMPSTFKRYAVDQTGDGRSDIFTNEEDVLASAANYLAKSGWKAGQGWGREVELPEGFDRGLLGLDQQKSIRHWQQLGVRQPAGADLPRARLRAALIQPDGEGGRVFMVYQNYRVIRAWNRSHNFALAVGLLADRLRLP